MLGVTPAVYRKRLERARRQLREALRGRCGLLDSAAPCQCGKRVNYAIAKGRIGPGGPVYATHARAANATKAAADLSHLRNVGELLRTHPDYAAPETRTRALLALIRSGRYEGLLHGE